MDYFIGKAMTAPNSTRPDIYKLSGAVLFFASIIFLVYSIIRYWDADHFSRFNPDYTLMSVSVIGMTGLVIAMGLLWSRVLMLLGMEKLPMTVIMRIHIVSWLGRYIPGKIGLFMGKVIMLKSHTVPMTVAGSSVIYEQILFLSSGVVIAAIGIGKIYSDFSGSSAVMLPIVMIALLMPHIMSFVFSKSAKFLSTYVLKNNVAYLSYWDAVRLMFLYGIPHILAGLGYYLFIISLLPDENIGLIASIGILAIAHVSGSLAVFAPAGVGVREAVMAGFLSLYMGYETAMLIAILTRLWSTVVDLGFALVVPVTLYRKLITCFSSK